jgi:hypothetical protein
VIFDLVEDGKGWVARGDLTGGRWAAGGLRMFNVGITRARQRLYLIANMAIINKAQGGPFHARSTSSGRPPSAACPPLLPTIPLPASSGTRCAGTPP